MKLMNLWFNKYRITSDTLINTKIPSTEHPNVAASKSGSQWQPVEINEKNMIEFETKTKTKGG